MNRNRNRNRDQWLSVAEFLTQDMVRDISTVSSAQQSRVVHKERDE